MDWKQILGNEEEKPLERLVFDGGFCRVFRTIGCIGDSLSSGEFESLDEEGNKQYHDCYEYSWGQYLARNTGCKVYNFSRGGMTAKEYWESFADWNGFWNQDKLCQAYIIALGVNDLIGQKQEMGSLEDINLTDYRKNRDTFAGYYGRIIQRLKELQPRAKFFLMTFPKEDQEMPDLAALLYDMARLFDNTYVLDIGKYGPVYDVSFKKKFFMGGHMNPAGYILTANMVSSYIDYIVRHNLEDFAQVGFIGTSYYAKCQ